MGNIPKTKLYLLFGAVALTLILSILHISGYINRNYFSVVLGPVLYPVQGAVSYFSNTVEGFVRYYKDVEEVKLQNVTLSQEVDRLQAENRELRFYKQREERLSGIIGLKSQFKFHELIGANVIAKDPGNWFCVFVIDRGRKDGLTEGLAVVTTKGLVGKLIEVNSSYSKVLSIIDPTSSVSARISTTRDIVVAKGNTCLGNSNRCMLDYVSENSPILNGDIVETSGIGSTLPKGIAIGEISSIKAKDGGTGKSVVVNTFVDFTKLEEVIVLK